MLYYKLEQNNNTGRYYARAIQNNKVSFDEIIDEIEQNCTARKGSVILVLTELAEVMRNHLLRGDKVSILDLGSFYVSIDNQSVEDPADFNPSKHINRFRINFQPVTRHDENGRHYYPMLTGIEAKPFPKI